MLNTNKIGLAWASWDGKNVMGYINPNQQGLFLTKSWIHNSSLFYLWVGLRGFTRVMLSTVTTFW